MAEPRGPAQRLRGAFYIYIVYLYIIYNRGFQLFIDRKGIQPLNPSGIINSTDLTNFFRVGLKSHTVFYNAGDVARRGSMDHDRRTPIGWTRGPPNVITHVSFKESYNGRIERDVAASHASIAWTRGAPEINQTRAYLKEL